jgi:hypothetical protein
LEVGAQTGIKLHHCNDLYKYLMRVGGFIAIGTNFVFEAIIVSRSAWTKN